MPRSLSLFALAVCAFGSALKLGHGGRPGFIKECANVTNRIHIGYEA